mgnify:CR=1 FL=1
MNLRSLSRGRVLRTRVTEKWSPEVLEMNEKIERRMLFTGFGAHDHGMGRARVCTMDPTHEYCEEYTQLFLHAPEMKYLLSRIERGEYADVRGRVSELLRMIDGGGNENQL